MALIYIKGEDEPIRFDDKFYPQVMEIFTNYVDKKGDGLVTVHGQAIKASLIKRVVPGLGSHEERAKMTNDECRAFGKELEPFFVDGRFTLKGKLTFLALKGVISLHFAPDAPESSTASDLPFAILDTQVDEYRLLDAKLSEWEDYRGRVEFAKKKDAEDLAEGVGVVAEGMRIDHDTLSTSSD